KWLSDNGRRKQILFVEEGRVVSDFDVPLTELPPLPVPPAEIVNKLVRKLEDENFLNRALLQLVPRGVILRFVLLVCSAVLAVLLLRRLWKARHRQGTAAPLAAADGARAVPPDLPLAAQRQRALLLDGNCWEAARTLARQCLAG